MKIVKVNGNDERKVVESLLFCKEIVVELFNNINPVLFRNNDHKSLVIYIKNYFEAYRDVPKANILQADFDLDFILPMVEKNKDVQQNVEYLKDNVIEFLRKRELEIVSSNIKALLEQNKINEAELELLSYQKPTKAIVQSFNPFDDIDEIFRHKESGLLHFPGDLGKMIGELYRGYFVAISGGFKRGKSFALQEFFFNSIINRLRVGFITLEMTQVDTKERLQRRFLSLADVQGLYRVPIFDCLKNQNGKCTFPTRVGKGCILIDGKRPPFNTPIAKHHKVCTACMGSFDYEPTSWYELMYKAEWCPDEVINKADKLKKLYGHFAKTRCFPRFSASMKDIRHELEFWHNVLDFHPDVLIIDYADIIKPDSKNSGFEKEDEIWMELAQIAAEYNILLITATQITRSGLNVDLQTEEHISKWVGKLAHVNVWIALNQTDEEKAANIMRWSLLEHRHKDFNRQSVCYVLQDIGIGQFNLGSYYKEIN